jgi:flavin-dependent dehydrogenase
MRGFAYLPWLAMSMPWSAVATPVHPSKTHDYDLVIVGGTGAGVAAAIQASRLNLSVALLEESRHIGGIAVEGAGGADLDSQPNFQNSLTIGPLVLELYRRMAAVYGRLEEFDQARADRVKSRDLWRYECYKGEQMFLDWLAEENVDIFIDTALKGTGNGEGVRKQGAEIKEILTECGQTFKAKYFIDATYEGDLLASAGVDYLVGRESRDTYGEPYAGVQYNSTYSNLQVPTDPYVEPGNPASGLIPTVQDYPLGAPGSG